MFKVSQKKFLTFLISAALVSIISDSSFAKTKSISPDYVYGKVVYSDNSAPVTNGFVKIYLTDNSGLETKILEITEIDKNGIFRIPREVITSDLNPKIMAYRNDYDNSEGGFISEVSEIKNILSNSENESLITIHVSRILRNRNTED